MQTTDYRFGIPSLSPMKFTAIYLYVNSIETTESREFKLQLNLSF